MKASKQLKVVIIMGPPGAGKGTQTMLVAESFRLSRLEMSKLLEERFQNAKPGETVSAHGTSYSLAEQQKRWKEGLLVEAPLVSQIFEEKLKELLEQKKSIVFDGFPRSIEQMEYIMPLLEETIEKRNILLFYLDISEGESLKRNSQRRVCELMRHPVLSDPQTEHLTICPLDGSKLLRRALDDPEVIKIRLQEFRNQTMPLLEYFKERGIAVRHIKAERSVSAIFDDISQQIQGA
jgi:adenylate kinase